MYLSMSITTIFMCNGDLNTQCGIYWNSHRKRQVNKVQMVTQSLNVNTQRSLPCHSSGKHTLWNVPIREEQIPRNLATGIDVKWDAESGEYEVYGIRASIEYGGSADSRID